MKGLQKAAFLVAFVALTATVTCMYAGDDADAASGGPYVLFDQGNGITTWIPVEKSEGTVSDVISGSLSSISHSFDASGAITVDGVSEETIGGSSTGGSFVDPGTTGVKITTSWRVFAWSGSAWSECSKADISAAYSGSSYAVGFYPAGVMPVETPDHRTSWTMIRGDAEQTGNQTADTSSTSKAETKWTDSRGGESGVYSAVLYANGMVYAKFGTGAGMGSGDTSALRCYTLDGNLVWSFEFPGIQFYETSTPVIVGDYIYTTSGKGFIFKVPLSGPGEDGSNVTTFDGKAYSSDDVSAGTGGVPYETGADLVGSIYSTGAGSLIYSSGAIFATFSNGMVYCFDLDLNLVWSSQMGGHSYYMSPTVADGYVFAGALNGCIYAMDKATGEILDYEEVYTSDYHGKKYGSVGAPSVIRKNGNYELFFTISDGRGMSSKVGGIGHYTFNGSSLTKALVQTDVGLTSNYVTPVVTDKFTGVVFTSSNGLYSMPVNGRPVLICSDIAAVKAPLTVVNGESIYIASYTANRYLYIVDMEGNITNQMPSPINNYNMSPITVIDGWILVGNDSGMAAVEGTMDVYVPPVKEETNPWKAPLAVLAAIIVILAAYYVVARLVLKIQKPFKAIGDRVRNYLGSESLTYNTKSRHRLKTVLLFGIIGIILMFMLCICVGPTSVLSPGDALSALWSAISKGGENLQGDEVIVYSSRVPRTMAALAVGIGLSIAGSMYQAIIRNPLVDPYIMGVSAGAGTAAVAVIAMNFTFFGLFASHSIYLTAIAAIVGGIVAFAATMIIAEKSGGSSTNYVLAGVVVGLAFSAAQTLMMSMAGNQVANALTWLFGSFSNISWNQIWLVFIPALFLSFVPLIWAKEFNLVLLGEDQAKQMGLDVRRFNRIMLILASVLTAICVAFVGIIGFVGLVIPHLCRMILGGDHRLVLPASIVLGAILMMGADFAAKMIIPGIELPVGAITTVIGVPVFAYLLIRKGRMYDG